MTVRRWLAVVSAVVVALLVAAGVLWGISAARGAAADRAEAAQVQAASEARDEALDAGVERRAVDEEECADDAASVEAGTYDYDSADGNLYRVAAGDYDVAFKLCMEDRGYSPPFD